MGADRAEGASARRRTCHRHPRLQLAGHRRQACVCIGMPPKQPPSHPSIRRTSNSTEPRSDPPEPPTAATWRQRCGPAPASAARGRGIPSRKAAPPHCTDEAARFQQETPARAGDSQGPRRKHAWLRLTGLRRKVGLRRCPTSAAVPRSQPPAVGRIRSKQPIHGHTSGR